MGRYLVFRLILSMVLALTSATTTTAMETEVDGYLRLRPAYRSVRGDTATNMESMVFQSSASTLQTFGLLQADAWAENYRAHIQFRPVCQFEQSDQSCKAFIDEAYVEWEPGPSTFILGGQFNVVNGQAYLANPTDWLEEYEDVDLSLDTSERRNLRQGVYLAGVEHSFPGGSVSLMAVPWIDNIQEVDDRLQLKLALSLIKVDTDFEILGLITNTNPGLGLNLSTTISDALVVYTEAAWRRDHLRSVFTDSGSQVVIEDTTEDGWYLNGVIGGQYTTSSGINLIAEYFYNGGGMDGSEWNLARTFFNSQGKQKSPEVTAESITLLAAGNQALDEDFLRQNYLFFRVNDDNWLLESEASLLGVVNLDDGSNVVRARLDKDLSDRFRMGVMGEYLQGGAWSEFGLRPWGWQVVFDLRYFF